MASRVSIHWCLSGGVSGCSLRRLCLLWLYLWNLQLWGSHKSRGAILILHKALHGTARVLPLVSNQSSCHSPTQRPTWTHLLAHERKCLTVRCGQAHWWCIANCGTWRRQRDWLKKKAGLKSTVFFSCWLKGHISQLDSIMRAQHHTQLVSRDALIQYSALVLVWGGLLWRGYRKWNVSVTELAESLCWCWFFDSTVGKNRLAWRQYQAIPTWIPAMPVIQPGEWFFFINSVFHSTSISPCRL